MEKLEPTHTAGGNVKWSSYRRKSVRQLLKKLNVAFSYNPTISCSWVWNKIKERNESRNLNRYLYSNVHCSIVHNMKVIEISQVFINQWADKQNVAYTFNGISFSHQRNEVMGTSLVVHWLRLRAPNTGGPGLIPGQGTRSHMPQLKVLHATTKTEHRQRCFLKRNESSRICYNTDEHWKYYAR